MYQIAGNNDGCYKLLVNPDGSANFIYYDYVSLELVYLSNQNTSAKDEANPGMIKEMLGGINPFIAGEKLYAIVPGYPRTMAEGYPAIPYQVDFSTDNRKQIRLSPLGDFPMNSAIAFDGENPLLMVRRFNEQNGQLETVDIVYPDFDEQKMVKAASLGKRDLQIYGTYMDGLVLRETTISTTGEQYGYINKYSLLDMITYEIKELDVSQNR